MSGCLFPATPFRYFVKTILYRLDTIKIKPSDSPLVNKVFSRYYYSMTTSKLYKYIERLSELTRVDTRQALLEFGLQPIQLEVLHYLSMCNGFSDTPMAVTEYLGQTKGTVSQTIKVLETKGLVEKLVDENDKRVVHLKVTTEGKKLLSTALPTPMLQAAIKGMSTTEQQQIEQSLDLLLSQLVNHGQMKSFGACHSCRYHQKTETGYFCHLVKQPLAQADIQLICREHLLPE